MFNIHIFSWSHSTLLALLIGCIGMLGMTNSIADDDDDEENLEYRWLMGQSDMDVTGVALCEMGSCPTAAAAGNGDTLILKGVGTLKVRASDGKPKKISGGGTFEHKDTNGVVVGSGTWKAKKLLMFDSYGGSPFDFVPTAFNAGRMLSTIVLEPYGGGKIRGMVELGCRVPGNPGLATTIEGVRVYIDDGPSFVLPFDPRSTLFFDLN